MTTEEVARIESELNLKLPDAYRRACLKYSFQTELAVWMHPRKATFTLTQTAKIGDDSVSSRIPRRDDSEVKSPRE